MNRSPRNGLARVFTALAVGLTAAILPCHADKANDFLSLSLNELASLQVTAQERSENLQDVPRSIYLLTGQQIAAANLRRSGDLAHITPSLGFDKRISFNKSSMKIRGIGTLVFGAGVEPSVATFVDGVVMSRGGAGLDDLPPEVARVEVLNGPQGTLFGKNASGGLIHIITPLPNRNEAAHFVSLMATDDREYRLALGSTGPLNDDLAYRLAAYSRDFAGNVYNQFNGHTLNAEQTWGLRGALQWDSVENLEFILRADYSRQDTSDGVRVLRSDSNVIFTDPAAIGASGSPGTAGQITGISGDADNDQVNLDRDPYLDSDAGGASLEINWLHRDYR